MSVNRLSECTVCILYKTEYSLIGSTSTYNPANISACLLLANKLWDWQHCEWHSDAVEVMMKVTRQKVKETKTGDDKPWRQPASRWNCEPKSVSRAAVAAGCVCRYVTATLRRERKQTQKQATDVTVTHPCDQWHRCLHFAWKQCCPINLV